VDQKRACYNQSTITNPGKEKQMSVILKRSEKSKHMPAECAYRCCTPIHGKNVVYVRRSKKRAERQDLKKDIRDQIGE